jgi:Fe-S cluster assembly iron-binding protein IscA
MKSIFGLLSLIAILTVSFTTTASANDSPTTKVVYDIGIESPMVFVSSVEIQPVIFEFGNVAVSPVNYTSGQEDTLVTDGSVTVSVDNDSITFVDVPIDYGIQAGTSSYTISNIDNETFTSCSEPDAGRTNKSDNSVETRYTDTESPVGWSTTKEVK